MRIRGFTLIELLVVISIISLLSSITLSAVSAARTKALQRTQAQSLKSLQIALELYRSDYGTYPTFSASSGYGPSSPLPGRSNWNNFITALSPYMTKVPDGFIGGPLGFANYWYYPSPPNPLNGYIGMAGGPAGSPNCYALGDDGYLAYQWGLPTSIASADGGLSPSFYEISGGTTQQVFTHGGVVGPPDYNAGTGCY